MKSGRVQRLSPKSVEPDRVSVKAASTLSALMPRLMQAGGHTTMLWSFCDQLMVSSFNFAIGIGAARYLGISEFGKFTLILMVAGFATVAQGIVVSMPMMTLAGKRERRSRSYYAAVTCWGAVLSLGSAIATTAIIGGIYLARNGSISSGLLAAVMIATALLSMHDVVRRVLFTQRRGGEAFLLDALRFVLFCGAVWWLHGAGTEVDAAVLLAVLGAAAAIAIVPFGPGLLAARVRSRMLKRIWHRHWLIARWLLLMILVGTGQEQVIWVGVAAGLGDAAVGALRAGQYLLGITHFVMMAVENFVPRQAAEEYRVGGETGLKSYLLRQTAALGVVTLLLILGVALPARFWLATVFGADYAQYAPLVWIYSVTYGVIFLRSIWVYYLRTVEDTRAVFRSFLVSSLTAIVCAYPAIAAFGISGAAFVVLAAHVICMACVLNHVRRHLYAASPRVAAVAAHGAG